MTAMVSTFPHSAYELLAREVAAEAAPREPGREPFPPFDPPVLTGRGLLDAITDSATTR